MLPVRRLLLLIASFTLSLTSLFILFAPTSLSNIPRQELEDAPNGCQNISIGFNLAPSAGYIAVDFHNGTVWVNVMEADDDHVATMRKLSLHKSEHLAPPYDNVGDVSRDWWRVFWRNRRKQLGLPASSDVGALSKVISRLREFTETSLSIRVIEAAISAPHLLALYQDDVQDILEYVGLYYVNIHDYYRPVLSESAAVFAGHGLYQYEGVGGTEDSASHSSHPEENVLFVHHADVALTFSLAKFAGPVYLWEPRDRHWEEFAVRSERNFDGSPEDEFYWIYLKHAMESFLHGQVKAYLPATKVIFVGELAPDNADHPFARLLFNVLSEVQSQDFEALYNDTTTVAARGTAELVKRHGFLENYQNGNLTLEL